jgi:flagellin
VADEVKGTFRLNANSGVVVGADKIADVQKEVGNDKNWALDGAYMLIKTAQQDKDNFNASDYKMVGPNGEVFDFVGFDDSGTDIEEADFNKLGNTIISNGKLVGSGDIKTAVSITLGNGGNTANTYDEDKIGDIAKGSILAKGSTIEMEDDQVLALNVGGKTVKLSFDGNVFKVDDAVVAGGQTFVLDDGTVLEHDGTTDGKFEVKQGRITLGQELNSTISTTYNIAVDSVLAAGSELKDKAELYAGTVIMNKDSTDAGKSSIQASVNFNTNGAGIQFSANAKTNLDASFDEMAVTDSFTFVFSKYQAATSDLKDSIMGQIGANSGQTMFVSMGDMRAKALGVDEVDISTKWGAATAIETVNNALQKVSSQRSALGAIQNRLEHTIKNLDVAAENLQAAESRIRDVDMAAEVMTFTKNNILQQASQAMLAQANQAPQSVLQLLR